MAISIVISVVLIIVVLLQSSKGSGLAGTFGGGQNLGSVFGTRRTADFLSRITWWLGGVLLFLALVINMFFLPGQSTSEQRESVIQSSQQQAIPTTPSLPPASTEQPATEGENQQEPPNLD